MAPEPPVEDHLSVRPPDQWATGVPAIASSMAYAVEEMGPTRTLKLLSRMNQKDGFDCMSCAWPDPDHRARAEFCENGARAVAWEATTLTVPTTFWAEHPISDLLERSEYWLGQQGRLVEPVYKAADSDHYVPIGWDEAFRLLADRLNGLDSPDQAAFYTSGRTANETAFVYQLFARAFGTNNLPDCSNMCHESTGAAMGPTVGVGKSTITYDDILQADLIIVMGQNPGTNHPRMLTALEEAKRNGASIVAVNPLPEAALQRFKNPKTVRGIVGRGTDIADQFLQIRSGGDMALLQWVSRRVLEAEDWNPGSVLDHEFLAEHTLGLDEFRAHLAQLDPLEVLAATGLVGRGDGRAGRPLHRGRSRHHHLGDGHHAAPQGRRHDQGDHQPPAAAREHRQARRGRLADPRAQQRAGRPDDGHLGEDVRRPSSTPSPPSSRSSLRASTASTRSSASRPCSAARSRSGSRSAATSSRRSPTPPPPRPRCAAPS